MKECNSYITAKVKPMHSVLRHVKPCIITYSRYNNHTRHLCIKILNNESILKILDQYFYSMRNHLPHNRFHRENRFTLKRFMSTHISVLRHIKTFYHLHLGKHKSCMSCLQYKGLEQRKHTQINL